ncbi:sensor histidine kinase [Nocardia wallacei]|uniref:sensor histidine kinase n=1 Tax=Nocardia wallacei TaxID=480035 RepID=UPI0024542D50|nr:HAMP domain-containing sensor histidine kinase [Nocardia wallacei]
MPELRRVPGWSVLRRRPRWLSSVRARTTAAATAVVAVGLVAAGAAVLAVLRHNLIDSASLQAEMTARNVEAQLVRGADPAQLKLPDADNQPVQVVSADGQVLAAEDDKLRGEPSMATGFSGAAEDAEEEDDDDDDEQQGDKPGTAELVNSSSAKALELRNMRLPIADDETGSHDFRVAALPATASGQPVTIYAGASLATADKAVSGARNAMLLGLPPLLVLVGGVTWLVTRRALRPVEAIRRELAEIMGGDLTRRVPEPDSHDEIARLAATTNATLAALEQSSERQRRFVADAAHELRSPIASLRTQLEVAQAHPHLLEVDGLIADSVRLEHLAADLLLLARLDAGERPRREPVDLAELVREELAHRAADAHPVLADLPDLPAPLLGSRIQIARVLGNLVDNAQRHAATAVRVTVRRTGGTVALEVSDDGRGIAPADRERVFQRFVRLDDARSRDEGGAGLGLAIVRDVVDRHGGEIRVDDGPAGGARFTVVFPAAP